MSVLKSRGDVSALAHRAATPARVDVEATVSALTASWDAAELANALCHAGVAAGMVVKGSQLIRKPTLAARGHFRMLDHPEMGTLAYNGPAYRFEATPSRLTSAAPRLGADTDAVLRDILSMTDDEIAEYRDQGVLT